MPSSRESETCDYVSSSSSEGKVKKGAYLVLRTLLQDKVNTLYKFPASAQRRLDETMDDYCATCIDTCGVDHAVCDTNINTFLDAIEQVFGEDMDGRQNFSTSSDSLSSIDTSDSPVTASTKRVTRWNKDIEAKTPTQLPPGVLWKKTEIKPSELKTASYKHQCVHIPQQRFCAFACRCN